MKPTKTTRSARERTKMNGSAMIEREIESILATEEELIPTSGFLASVMERVEEEAAAPTPIRFPWKRAVPGIVLASVVFGWGTVELVRVGLGGLGLPDLNSLALSAPHLSAAFVRPVESAGWVALALGVSLVSWLLSRRLVGRGGLL